jgi:hypothetical protein
MFRKRSPSSGEIKNSLVEGNKYIRKSFVVLCVVTIEKKKTSTKYKWQSLSVCLLIKSKNVG